MNKITLSALLVLLSATTALAQIDIPSETEETEEQQATTASQPQAAINTSMTKEQQKEILYRVHLGRADDVKLLIDGGASPNFTNDEGIPLLALAAVRKDAEGINVMKTLLASGADMNGRDSEGQTALFHAARVGNKDAVMLLLESGINYYQVDNNGDIARNIAHKEGHAELLGEMDGFVKAQADKIKQQYVEYNQQLQERYNAERKIVERYEAEKRAREDEELDDQEYQHQQAIAENAAREAEYQQALANLQNIEERKRALILEKRNLPVFSESLRDLAFNTCAFQYWSFCKSMNQTTEIRDAALTDAIDGHYAKITELSESLIKEYELDQAYVDKIVDRSKKRAFNPLARMPSKTYRFQNGVGKISDMNTRCGEVAKYWNVESVIHLDTPPATRKKKQRDGLFGG